MMDAELIVFRVIQRATLMIAATMADSVVECRRATAEQIMRMSAQSAAAEHEISVARERMARVDHLDL